MPRLSKKNILRKLYQGLIEQISAEIDYVSDILKHEGEKGRANERILSDFLTRFLPKRLSIGTGIVIDRLGNQSRQSDIVIYDSHLQPAFYAQRVPVLFPVDTVYATIEIKTRLRTSDIKQSVENIASVKRLNYLKEDVTKAIFKPDGSRGLLTTKTSPPLGFIFSFKTKIDTLETIKRNFVKATESLEEVYHPDLCIILNRGVLVGHKDISPDRTEELQIWAAGYRGKSSDGTEGWLLSTTKDLIVNEGERVRRANTIGAAGDRLIVDPARAFLNFLMLLIDGINLKSLVSRSFLREYLGGIEFSRLYRLGSEN